MSAIELRRERSVACVWCQARTWNDDAVCDKPECRHAEATYRPRGSAS